jgi:hypothetical protein
MRLRHVLTVVLLVVAAASASAIGILLLRRYSGQELADLCSSLQVVILVFTASAGLLALIKYWGSVEAELDHKRREKLNQLEMSYQRFREQHNDVTQAFDWPHILRQQYLPLCEKAIAYDEAKPEDQPHLLNSEEISRVRLLDDFLEFFENLYFAVSRRLVNVDDLLIFLQYYIILVGDTYYNPEDTRLRKYIDHFYYNIRPLLDLVERHLRKHPDRRINRNFEHYPRRWDQRTIQLRATSG